MVSFHTPLSPTRRRIIPELQNLLKKRKRDDGHDHEDQEISSKSLKAKTINFGFDNDHLFSQTPLPLEWQRCLDVKSGQIYYYNTKTNKKTSNDPRLSIHESSGSGADHMSLDLELNLLSCKNTSFVSDNFSKENGSGGIKRSPSWLAFEGDQREMVTAVCKKCHMLVMMCKSSPTCPNCKFIHPPENKPTNHSPPRLNLFC